MTAQSAAVGRATGARRGDRAGRRATPPRAHPPPTRPPPPEPFLVRMARSVPQCPTTRHVGPLACGRPGDLWTDPIGPVDLLWPGAPVRPAPPGYASARATRVSLGRSCRDCRRRPAFRPAPGRAAARRGCTGPSTSLATTSAAPRTVDTAGTGGNDEKGSGRRSRQGTGDRGWRPAPPRRRQGAAQPDDGGPAARQGWGPHRDDDGARVAGARRRRRIDDRTPDGRNAGGRQPPKPESAGREMSGFSNSSTLTSLNVITRTFFTNRAGRYMSQTQASCISTSK
jgi:hypothetical protein